MRKWYAQPNSINNNNNIPVLDHTQPRCGGTSKLLFWPSPVKCGLAALDKLVSDQILPLILCDINEITDASGPQNDHYVSRKCCQLQIYKFIEGTVLTLPECENVSLDWGQKYG